MIPALDGIRETVAFRDGFGIRLYLNSENESYPLHWHTAAEVIMPLDNIYTVNVDDRMHVLSPGDILIIPPGELHELVAPESGRRLIVQFDFSLLHNVRLFDSIMHLLRPVCLVKAAHAQGEETNESPQALLTALQEEYFGESMLKEAAAYGLLIQFLVRIGRDAMREENRERRPAGGRYHRQIDTFMRVCHYMNEHFARDIKVEELADVAGYSKFHFTRLFKQYIGISYYEYLKRQRIMHAEKLLVGSDLPVTEAAMRSGFGSLATFNRVFKAHRKCTPTQYKQLYVDIGFSEDMWSST